jgi:hypothetical protein
MNFTSDSDDNWAEIANMLPPNRDEMARTTKAFERPREIKTSDHLLRLVFLYAWADLSLRETAATANEAELASVSDVALLKRFRKVPAWIEAMIVWILKERVPPPVLPALPYRIRIADGSSISLPNSHGTDYRLHAQYSLLTQRFDALHLTDARGGESFQNYRVQEGDLFLGDRAYGNRAGIAHVVQAGGHVLVRLAWNHLPLQTREGTPFDLMAALSSLPAGQFGDWQVQTVPEGDLPALPGRIVALPKTEAATQKAVRLATKAARKKHHQIQPQTLLACGYIFVFTTLPVCEADAGLVLALYRFRWQVEMAFKLLKSQLNLDHVRAQDPDLVRAYLLCKLLGALLLEDLTGCWVSFSPRGLRYDLPVEQVAPVCIAVAGVDCRVGTQRALVALESEGGAVSGQVS